MVNNDNTPVQNTKFVNKAICHLFEEIRYELNAIEIDKCKNVGLISLMKGSLSLNPSQISMIENAGWINMQETERKINNDAGYFEVVIPLSMILGFVEDCDCDCDRKIVIVTVRL